MPDTEKQFTDDLTDVIDAYRNILHRDRASKVLEAQADIVSRDETWTTYVEDDGTEPAEAPTLDSLEPDTAVSGDAEDITMRCIGTGFTADSTIFFNGLPEPTTMVSDTELTTGVKPSLFVVPAVCPVEIHTGSQVTEALDFTFT